MRAVLAILLGACLVHAEPLGLNCASCQLPIKGKYLLFSAPGSPDKAPVCEACAQLETSCFLCGIPVKADGLKLEDGRFVCPRDSKTAVCARAVAHLNNRFVLLASPNSIFSNSVCAHTAALCMIVRESLQDSLCHRLIPGRKIWVRTRPAA